MLRRFGSHVRNQWMGALALFLVLTGGVAYAANTVFSTDIVNNQVRSVDVRNENLPGGGLTTEDIYGLGGHDIEPESITGLDVTDQSGVDTCVATVRIGQLCFRAENVHRTWDNARAHCANLDLRVPTLGEATELAQTHDLPNVDDDEFFWTDEVTIYPEGSGVFSFRALIVSDGFGSHVYSLQTNTEETVCVTTPTN